MKKPPILDHTVRHPDFTENGIELCVRRYDLLHTYAGGNKLFKLEYWLKERKANQAVLSFGGCYSNHLLALSAVGQERGFETIGIVRGEEADNPWLSIMRENGMSLSFIGRDEYRAKQSPEFLERLGQEFCSPIIVPEGGAGPIGARGASRMVEEREDYDVIALAGATGTTLAGIASKNTNAEILCFQVLKGEDAIRNQLVTYFDLSDYERVRVIEDFHFGGYARMPEELWEFIAKWKKYSSIPIDPVYTAKALYGLASMAGNRCFKPGTRVLFLHTGGNARLFSQASR